MKQIKWRASFQRLSTNSLSKLEEATTNINDGNQEVKSSPVKEGWKEDFSQKEAGTGGMTKRDSFVVQEEDESGMVF